MSTDLKRIKERLLQEDKIEELLESIGCEYVKTIRGVRVEAQLPQHKFPDSTNTRGVQVRLNESLSSAIRNRSDFEGGSIYDIVSFIHHDKRDGSITRDVYNAAKYICNLFNWNDMLDGDNNYDNSLDWLRQIRKERKRERKAIEPNPVLPESILNDYYINGEPIPSYDWFMEGISYKTQKFYGVGFDWDSKRIILPCRNRKGELIGTKGRIMVDEDDDRKYMYLDRFKNSIELFNLWNAAPYVKLDKSIILFEGEKSCLKCFQYGIYNTVSIGSSEITQEQAETIKDFGIDVKIYLAFDSDKTPTEIHKQARYFEGREVYALYGGSKVLGKKSAPIDKGVDVFNKLVENAVHPDELLEHYNAYLEKKRHKK